MIRSAAAMVRKNTVKTRARKTQAAANHTPFPRHAPAVHRTSRGGAPRGSEILTRCAPPHPGPGGADECGYANPDWKLDWTIWRSSPGKRGASLHEALVRRPWSPRIRRLAGNRAQEVRFTRFLRNERVGVAEMASHAEAARPSVLPAAKSSWFRMPANWRWADGAREPMGMDLSARAADAWAAVACGTCA